MKSFRFTLAILVVLGWTSSAQAIPFIFNSMIDAFQDPSTSFTDSSNTLPIDMSDQQAAAAVFGGIRESRTQAEIADEGFFIFRAVEFSVGGGNLEVTTSTLDPNLTTRTTLIYDGDGYLPGPPPPVLNNNPLIGPSVNLLSNPTSDGIGLSIVPPSTFTGGKDFRLTLNTRNAGVLESATVSNIVSDTNMNLVFFDFNLFTDDILNPLGNANANLTDVFALQLEIIGDGSVELVSRGLGVVAIAVPGSALVLGIGLVGLVGFMRYRRVPMT